jgi:hypothetical protein
MSRQTRIYSIIALVAVMIGSFFLLSSSEPTPDYSNFFLPKKFAKDYPFMVRALKQFPYRESMGMRIGIPIEVCNYGDTLALNLVTRDGDIVPVILTDSAKARWKGIREREFRSERDYWDYVYEVNLRPTTTHDIRTVGKLRINDVGEKEWYENEVY